MRKLRTIIYKTGKSERHWCLYRQIRGIKKNIPIYVGHRLCIFCDFYKGHESFDCVKCSREDDIL